MRYVLLIALLAFTGLSHSSDVGGFKICHLMQNGTQFSFSEERCPGMKRGAVISGISWDEAVIYCEEPIIHERSSVICAYNGQKIATMKDITDYRKGKCANKDYFCDRPWR